MAQEADGLEKNKGQLLRGSDKEPRGDAPTLAEVGLTKKQLHDFRKTASGTAAQFEAVIERLKERRMAQEDDKLLKAKQNRTHEKSGADAYQTIPASIAELGLTKQQNRDFKDMAAPSIRMQPPGSPKSTRPPVSSSWVLCGRGRRRTKPPRHRGEGGEQAGRSAGPAHGPTCVKFDTS
jgi:hypothetical protein